MSVGLILLAAGGSARLGRPKQLLEYEGKALLRCAAETALASKCRPIVVVLGAESEACSAALQGLPVRIVVNPSWQEGLSSSIRAGLAVLEKEPTAVAATILSVADQPHLTPALLDSLSEHQRATGKKIIAAQYAGVPGPPALFCESLFPQLKTLQGDEGARRVLLANPDEVVLVPFPKGSLDVDTIEDYKQLSSAIKISFPVFSAKNAARHIASHMFLYGCGYFIFWVVLAMWIASFYPNEMNNAVFCVSLGIGWCTTFVLGPVLRRFVAKH